MIIDTNGLSELAKGDTVVARVMGTSARHQLPVIILGEYRFGLRRSRHRAVIEEWLDRFELECDILEVTRQTVDHYADIREELRLLGRPIPENDLWIAAIARERQLAILSRDVHFDVVPGLIRFGW